MLNQVVLIGRLANDIKLEEENNKNVARITLALPRSFKNAEGEYETDFIEIIIWDQIADKTTEYCKKGDILGIKGRLQNKIEENDLGERKYKTEVIAEKVTYLTRRNYDMGGVENE